MIGINFTLHSIILFTTRSSLVLSAVVSIRNKHVYSGTEHTVHTHIHTYIHTYGILCHAQNFQTELPDLLHRIGKVSRIHTYIAILLHIFMTMQHCIVHNFFVAL
jgi:hypothetical protein